MSWRVGQMVRIKLREDTNDLGRRHFADDGLHKVIHVCDGPEGEIEVASVYHGGNVIAYGDEISAVTGIQPNGERL